MCVCVCANLYVYVYLPPDSINYAAKTTTFLNPKQYLQNPFTMCRMQYKVKFLGE